MFGPFKLKSMYDEHASNDNPYKVSRLKTLEGLKSASSMLFWINNLMNSFPIYNIMIQSIFGPNWNVTEEDKLPSSILLNFIGRSACLILF